MDALPRHPTVCCLPRWFHCRARQPIELRILAAEEGSRLTAMYLAFQPRNSFQGLPPIKDEVCRRWVEEMLRTGLHVIARSAGTIVGHAGLFPINQQKCEMLVVVSPSHQNLGVGTQLVRGAIDVAAELGFERIWLPVEASNMRARHVYQKCGFEYVSARQARELDMVCHVADACTGPSPVAGELGHALPSPHFAMVNVRNPRAEGDVSATTP